MQASVTPEQAEFLLSAVFLPSLKNEHRITAAVMNAIPADNANYRPDPVSMSAFDIAWHIAMSEMTFLNAVVTGGFDFTPNPRPESVKTPQDLAIWYAESCESRFDALSKLTGEQLAKVLDFRGMFNLPAVMYTNFVLLHTCHHRGQLATYLRPAGGKVPSIYGESFDAAEARKAAQAQSA